MERSDRDRIRKYYADGAEQQRLESSDGWFERDRTLSIVERFVPAGAHVLDAGGGAGVYTTRLAERGYSVSMIDLSPELVDIARNVVAALPDAARQRVSSVEVCDLANLAEGDFDAVLCVGPGYHVGSLDELDVMVARCLEVTRPGGVVMFSFIPRISGVAGLVARAAGNHAQVLPGTLTTTLETGRFRNDDEGFGEAYFAQPDDVVRAFERHGAERLTLRSIRGFAAYYGQAISRLRDESPERYEEFLRLTEETAELPEVVATCWHAMYVARKR